MTEATLPPDALQAALASLPDWTVHADAGRQELTRHLRFADFGAAMRFMEAAATIFEAQDHHPRWTNEYDSLTIALTTHDADDRITARDLRAATSIDQLLRTFS